MSIQDQMDDVSGIDPSEPTEKRMREIAGLNPMTQAEKELLAEFEREFNIDTDRSGSISIWHLDKWLPSAFRKYSIKARIEVLDKIIKNKPYETFYADTFENADLVEAIEVSEIEDTIDRLKTQLNNTEKGEGQWLK